MAMVNVAYYWKQAIQCCFTSRMDGETRNRRVHTERRDCSNDNYRNNNSDTHCENVFYESVVC